MVSSLCFFLCFSLSLFLSLFPSVSVFLSLSLSPPFRTQSLHWLGTIFTDSPNKKLNRKIRFKHLILDDNCSSKILHVELWFIIKLDTSVSGPFVIISFPSFALTIHIWFCRQNSFDIVYFRILSIILIIVVCKEGVTSLARLSLCL